MEGRQNCVVQMYQSGRISLASGIDAVRRHAKSGSVTVWLPGYFCNEALEPLRSLPLVMRFYPMQDDLSPDWHVLEKWASSDSVPQIFVLVHYFGFPNVIEEARSFCDQYGNKMVLLEDASHVLFPYLSVGLGDVMIFSPRKLLAVPSGGILLIPKDLAPYVNDASEDWEIEETLRWLARRLAQRILVRLHVPWHLFRVTRGKGEQFDGTNGLGQPQQEKCDPFVLKLLSVMEQDMDEVIERRRCYYQRLLGWTSELVHARPLFGALPRGVCPYAFPLLVKHGSKDVATRLQSWGIPAGQWPDMPPEVLADKENQGIAISTYEKLLLLPVHQSLTLKQIDVVGQSVRLALAGSS